MPFPLHMMSCDCVQYIHNLMPRGQYTSGKGSSAVGLTAYVSRDPETKQLVLQTYVTLASQPVYNS